MICSKNNNLLEIVTSTLHRKLSNWGSLTRCSIAQRSNTNRLEENSKVNNGWTWKHNLGVYTIYNLRALGYSALTVAKQALTALNKKQVDILISKNQALQM